MAATHPLTLEQLEDGHALILGTTGSGKTYQLRGILEVLRRAGFSVGAVDKLGNHWGLTLSADGNGKGLEFVIFGGKRAHVPMGPDDGARLGRVFVEKNIPAIFDVSQWHSDDQQHWVAEFADAVFTAIDGGSLHLALDEAQSWVPQGGGGEAFRSVQRLAEQGRGNGLRLLLTCQRLSRLDATVRGMMHTVIAMRQTSTIDRKAVADLVAGDRDDLQLLEQLPKLKTGTGFLWQPTHAGLELIEFPANATFDSSRTPRHGDKSPPPVAVSSRLVDELKVLLAPPAEPHPDDVIPVDPNEAWAKGSAVGIELKKRDDRIAELEAEVAKWREQHRYRGEFLDRIQADRNRLQMRLDMIRRDLDVPILAKKSRAKTGAETEARNGASVEPVSRPAAGRTAAPPPPARRSSAEAAGDLPGQAEKMAAMLDRIAPARVTWASLAAMVQLKSRGGHFNAGRKALRESGRVIEEGETIRSALPPADGLTREAARQLWKEVLTNPSPQMIDALHVRSMTKGELGDFLGIAPRGGHFNNGVAQLVRNGVAMDVAGKLHLAEPLPGERP